MLAKSEPVIRAVCQTDGQYDGQEICHDFACRDGSTEGAGSTLALRGFREPHIDSEHVG
jgi:hypothetical protein